MDVPDSWLSSEFLSKLRVASLNVTPPRVVFTTAAALLAGQPTVYLRASTDSSPQGRPAVQLPSANIEGVELRDNGTEGVVTWRVVGITQDRVVLVDARREGTEWGPRHDTSRDRGPVPVVRAWSWSLNDAATVALDNVDHRAGGSNNPSEWTARITVGFCNGNGLVIPPGHDDYQRDDRGADVGVLLKLLRNATSSQPRMDAHEC